MKEGQGPSFFEIQQPLEKGWQDPAGSTDHLNPDGSRKGWKVVKKSVNWLFNVIQDTANVIIPEGKPEPGPNIGNREDKFQRRRDSQDR